MTRGMIEAVALLFASTAAPAFAQMDHSQMEHGAHETPPAQAMPAQDRPADPHAGHVAPVTSNIVPQGVAPPIRPTMPPKPFMTPPPWRAPARR